MTRDVAIRVERLSKQYVLGGGVLEAEGLRHLVHDVAAAPLRWLRGRRAAPPRRDVLWALDDVSFDVPRGDVVGVVGRNGAGKSTLLKILSRITEPTRGRVGLNGRVGSLLEVGTGFHPELTGRENVFLNGAILGMTRREVRVRLDEIVAFAEVERFLDVPVKRYSSGMSMRLAFAVAAHLEPEILVIDEVLAVGDVAFQKKCLAKMGEVSRHGRTVLFVSHNMQAVRNLCKTALWLREGRLFRTGESGAVVEAYLEAQTERVGPEDLARRIRDLPADPSFRLRDVALVQGEAPVGRLVLSGRPLEVVVQYSVLKRSPGLHVYVVLFDAEGTLLLESLHNGDAADLPVVEAGDYVSRLTIPAEFLAPRSYEIEIRAAIANVRAFFDVPIRLPFEVEASGRFNRAYPGYVTPGKLAPLLAWETTLVAGPGAARAEAAPRP